MRKLSVVALLAFVLIGFGCQSSDSAEKEDGDKATAEQPAEQQEGEEKEGSEAKDEDKEKDKEEKSGEEHPGDEHPGDEAEEGEEHPGDEAEGDEHPGDEAKKESFTAEEIKSAMKSHIKNESGDNGVFSIQDEKAGEKLQLKFVKIHDPVRKMEGKGYFACTDFHAKDADKKLYDLDFWLNPNDGELTVTKSKIHKHPAKKDGEWKKEARYTFQNDKVVELD